MPVLRFDAEALRAFGALVGDVNPVHAGEGAIVHAGLLVGAVAAEATRLNPGMVCARIVLDFDLPFRAGEEITVMTATLRDLGRGRIVGLLAAGELGGVASGECVLMEEKER